MQTLSLLKYEFLRVLATDLNHGNSQDFDMIPEPTRHERKSMTKLYIEAITFGNYALEQMTKRVRIFSQDQSGATAVEYSLIVALVAIAITAAATTLGTNVSNLFNHAACSVRSGVWTAATNTCTP